MEMINNAVDGHIFYNNCVEVWTEKKRISKSTWN